MQAGPTTAVTFPNIPFFAGDFLVSLWINIQSPSFFLTPIITQRYAPLLPLLSSLPPPLLTLNQQAGMWSEVLAFDALLHGQQFDPRALGRHHHLLSLGTRTFWLLGAYPTYKEYREERRGEDRREEKRTETFLWSLTCYRCQFWQKWDGVRAVPRRHKDCKRE